jgi:hypothetical protein
LAAVHISDAVRLFRAAFSPFFICAPASVPAANLDEIRRWAV